jgi:hypothetical protein
MGRPPSIGLAARAAAGALRLAARAAAVALCLCGCAGTLDVDRAKRWLEPTEEPSVPALQAAATAELPAPEGLRAASGELRQVALRWDPLLSDDVAGYVVERSGEREGPFQRVAAVAGRANTVWVDDGHDAAQAEAAAPGGLDDGETLFYRVRAFSRVGEQGRNVSPVVAATTAPPPDPPPGLRAYSMQPREVPLSWQPSSDPHVAGYVIERSPTSRGPFVRLARIEGRHRTAFVDRGLGDLRVFYYRVASLNTAGGRGAPGEPVRAVTKPEPLPPLGLAVASQRLGENELAWEPNVERDLAGYRLLRTRADGGSELVATLPPATTRVIDAGVAANERVSYTIVAVDDDGLVSSEAEPIEVESVGYELSATLRPDGVHLAWNPRTDEGFSAARVFVGGALRQSELGRATDGSFVHDRVQPGHTYRYTVVLERSDGRPVPPSAPVELRVPEA